MRKVKSARKQLFPNRYRPDLDQSNDLIPDLALHYLWLIGILCWVVELRLINIFTEVELISQYLASLILVHLGGLYHMFEYISNHEISRVVFDPFQPKFDEIAFASGMINWN